MLDLIFKTANSRTRTNIIGAVQKHILPVVIHPPQEEMFVTHPLFAVYYNFNYMYRLVEMSPPLIMPPLSQSRHLSLCYPCIIRC